MKIIYLINSFQDGGAELGLVTLVESGFFAGHDLIIQALACDRSTVRQRLIENFSAKDGRSCISNLRWLFESSTLRDRDLPASVIKLIRILWREKPDVLILSLPQANLVGRLASIATPKAKVVSFEHSAGFRRAPTKLLMRLTAHLVDAIFYDHEETWRCVRSLYPNIPDNSAHYVPLTILSPDHNLRSFGDRDRCLIAGRLTSEKNHVELLYAIRIAAERGYRLHLTIAGEGPLRSRLEALVHELDLSRQVIFTGFVQDLAKLRANCEIYVQSSHFEGLCLSVLEAMAAGMLVVTTDVGAIRHYGKDGLNMIKLSGPGRRSIAEGLLRAKRLSQNDVDAIRQGALRTIQESFTASTVRYHWDRALNGLMST